MSTDIAAVVRRFNRSYTQRIGALDDSFLGMGLPLGTARLLFEIGAEPGTVQTCTRSGAAVLKSRAAAASSGSSPAVMSRKRVAVARPIAA